MVSLRWKQLGTSCLPNYQPLLRVSLYQRLDTTNLQQMCVASVDAGLLWTGVNWNTAKASKPFYKLSHVVCDIFVAVAHMSCVLCLLSLSSGMCARAHTHTNMCVCVCLCVCTHT